MAYCSNTETRTSAVGLGLPLAGADVQGVLVVNEQIEFLGGGIYRGNQTC